MAYSRDEKDNILAAIFENIENGSSLRAALKGQSLSSALFFRWIDGDEVKLKQYARACDIRAEALVDEMLDIADGNNADVYIDDNGKAQIDGNAIQRSRLMVDTRKWLASKLKPKKYGDRLDVTSMGEKITPIIWKEEKTYEADDPAD